LPCQCNSGCVAANNCCDDYQWKCYVLIMTAVVKDHAVTRTMEDFVHVI
ncbi:hypothetical protein AM593_06153, partial [Mytilus galloprovincialis]